MNSWIGWTLAALLVLAGWTQYGWQGALFAVSAVVFWLLLQFNKAVRVMRQAGRSPLGSVESAVMFNAKLKPGMPMLEIVMLAKSLGQKLGDGCALGYALRVAVDEDVHGGGTKNQGNKLQG